MNHPLIPKIIELAQPIARDLNLEIVDAVFLTNQSPPRLRVDIRSLQDDTSLDNCEQMSRALEAGLDESGMIPDAYVLEISSPGLSSELTTERDFITFRGFPILVKTRAPHKGQTEWVGRLIDRTADQLRLNLKGRTVTIPRESVLEVWLQDQE